MCWFIFVLTLGSLGSLLLMTFCSLVINVTSIEVRRVFSSVRGLSVF